MASKYDLPNRAPIQFWMMTTFALFVGVAVLIVGAYALFVLEKRAEAEAGRIIVDETIELATTIQRPMPRAERELTLRQLSRLTDLRITLWNADTLALDVYRGHVLRPGDQSEPGRDLLDATFDGTGLLTAGPGDEIILYAGVRVPGTRMFLRVGQTNPPIRIVSSQMRATLIVGLLFALVLAVLGAWIAATRVANRIKQLAESARQINEGELTQEIPVESRAAEFQDLAISLNGMANTFRTDIDKLQKLIRIQNEFLGNISHEVRNPIFAINGYLEALASENLSEPQRKRYAKKGVANLDRLTNLFSDLIEIARLEYREDLLQQEEFSIVEVTEDVIELSKPRAATKGLKLSLESEPLRVFADRNRIRQVLNNLIDNAIAYTDSGTVSCSVSEFQGKCLVEVIDTGKGIPAEHVDRIFDRFYRVDAARSRKYGGSGLGLSIVHQILQAHGQKINVESEVGVGTRFWFSLPLAEEKKPEPEKAVSV
ncbi:MAG: HAMP domain-containing sensor histidine kinase [Candidatus Latescibacterota bacterium]|jgi:signal transduction histidine kinase